MSFDSANALRRSSGRAKSDVANKLVSMFLHEVSRRACVAGGMTVSHPDYLRAVVGHFGHQCLYCRGNLENDRAAVEHLDGMNRFRVGLHIPGNVAVACRKCNNEKRRDDQKPTLTKTGWESFLSHDGATCESACKTCVYWKHIWPNPDLRKKSLKDGADQIQTFQGGYLRFTRWSNETRSAIQNRVETLYRTGQEFATTEIETLSSELNFDFTTLTEDEDPTRNP